MFAPFTVKINVPEVLLVMPPDPAKDAMVLLNPPISNVPDMFKSVPEGKPVAIPSRIFEPEPTVVDPP